MIFAAGTKVGPYEIVLPIGAGGMGQVYKARDTRLNRFVAIKVLPEHVSTNRETKIRFEREAQTLASLSHPHICSVFDVGQDDGTDYLVMELVEGQTLAQRLEKGALPLEEALKIATEIADALDKAHQQGVIHRDVKPSNVMLAKSGAKLLDFGLAKLKESKHSTTLSALPTREMTAEGTILGTLQYMAPEQLEGQEADARTDIFAFGAVLYEMVTGQKAFEGKSQASLISAIMSSKPQFVRKLQPLAPAALEHVVQKCLEKDSDKRCQTARDLVSDLAWIAEEFASSGNGTVHPKSRSSRGLLPLVIALVLVTVTIAGTRFYLRPVPATDEVQFLIETPIMVNPAAGIALSQDGRWLAFTASGKNGGTSLFVRALNTTTVREIPDTNGAQQPFWSPDGRNIGFFANGQLKRVGVAEGSSQIVLCDAPAARGGTWNESGDIVFSSGNILYHIAAAGGAPTPITSLNESLKEVFHGWPNFLPDGRHFLYLSWPSVALASITVASLDSKETKFLLRVPSMAMYSDPGYLVYVRQGGVFAHPFDVRVLGTSGDPIQIADQAVFRVSDGAIAVATSRNGVLAYHSVGTLPTQRFVWFDRGGRVLENATEPGAYTSNFDLSPDAKQIAASILEPDAGSTDLWLIEWQRGVKNRFPTGFVYGSGRNVVWSPDGRRLAYGSGEKGYSDIVIRDVTAQSEPQVILGSSEPEYIKDWSKDGRYILFLVGGSQGAVNKLSALSLMEEKTRFVLIESRSGLDQAHFSYDGKWVAYNSFESGMWQVYAISFLSPEQKRQISINGGVQPRWRRDGKELYYLSLDGKMMVVDVSLAENIGSGIPRVLFDTGVTVDPLRDQYVVTPDGQRFLILQPVAGAKPTPITVVLNWTAMLK